MAGMMALAFALAGPPSFIQKLRPAVNPSVRVYAPALPPAEIPPGVEHLPIDPGLFKSWKKVRVCPKIGKGPAGTTYAVNVFAKNPDPAAEYQYVSYLKAYGYVEYFDGVKERPAMIGFGLIDRRGVLSAYAVHLHKGWIKLTSKDIRTSIKASMESVFGIIILEES